MSIHAIGADEPPPRLWRRWFRRLLQFLDPQGNPSEVIYGTLLAGVVLATKAHKGVTGAAIFWSAVGALVLYWAAHVYADVIGEQVKTRKRTTWATVRHAAADDWTRLRASLIPVLFFEIVRLGRGSVNTSVLSALWLTVGLLGAWGATAAFRSGARGVALVLETTVCGLLGVLVVVLKVVLY
ncbi:MAG TPA: hypothetical protein VHZ96_23825 [Frankiaceae bacterium]|nr:hypothetical protein [Frankiaceae bacterium]